MNYLAERELMLKLLQQCYAKGHTDTTGGIATVRVDKNHYLNTATGISWRRFQDAPEDIVLLNNRLERLGGERKIPASSQIAIGLLEAFPEAGAVIHIHSNCTGAFAATGVELTPITPFAQRVGEVPVLYDETEDEWIKNGGDENVLPLLDPNQDVLNGTRELIVTRHRFLSTVVRALRPRSHELQRHGLAFIVGFDYGMFIIGRQLGEAYDTIERVENNAQLLLNCASLQKKANPCIF